MTGGILARRTPKIGLYYNRSLSNVQKESASSNSGSVRNLRLTVKILKRECQPSSLARGRKPAAIFPGTLPDRARVGRSAAGGARGGGGEGVGEGD